MKSIIVDTNNETLEWYTHFNEKDDDGLLMWMAMYVFYVFDSLFS